ncbi:methyl farnesoate epoxidase [Bacillus rossius redtenbacheri]|uniref:methyl farnesoate epoxidase n=1 Tax=Bacillus rossius redtenbacheri TaxID=93214 RepID=UPI002FDEE7C1
MWLAAILFLCILALLIYLDTRKPKNFPPGPAWLPIVGSALTLHLLRRSTGYLYKATAELARQYGPVVGLKVGKDRIVVLHSHQAIRDMMSREEFDGRPTGLFYETRTWGVRRGVLLTDEEFWQEQRRFVLRHLREFGFGRRTMAQMVEEEAAHMVAALRARAGSVLPMHDAFGVYVLNTLWSMMAGVRYSADDTELKKLQGLLSELFANIDMVGSLFSQFPLLRFLAPELSGYKQFLFIHHKLWKFLKAELDRHKKTFTPDYSRDFMDVYLHMLASEHRKPSFSELQLLAICLDMFIAGSETTAKSLGFGLLYMLLYPEVQRKVQAEVDSVVGRDRLPTLADRPNMPYTEALVLECLRMFIGRSFAIPHRALKDTELQGYFIPKGTMVVTNLNGAHMSSQLWDEPQHFRPERFLDEQGRVTVPDYYTPFGIGRRRCMGDAMAKANMFVFLASLLQNFTFAVPPGQAPPCSEGLDGATPAPKPFEALVLPRS